MLFPPVYVGYADSTLVSVDPADSYVAVGKSVNVNISVTDVANLTCWQFTLCFLKAILNCTNVAEGPFLKSVNATFFGENITNNYNSTNGEVEAYCTLLANNSVANGNGVLATVTFNALSAGDSPLNLSDTVLGDQNIPSQPIAHTDVDGTVHVQNLTLTVTTVGGGTVTLNDTGPYYTYGEVVQLTALPSTGWSFNQWSGNLSGSANPTTIVMTDNMAVTATFTQNNYTLSSSVSGSGSVNLNNTGPYHYGDVVQLSAVPSTGWSFQTWSGNLSGSANPATLTITGNMFVTATFTQNQYTLSVTVVGGGSVSESPSQATYTWGTNVTLTALANAYWLFACWSGDASGTTNPTQVNMTGNMFVTATFTQINYTLSVSVWGSGSVTVNNSGPYHYGDAVLLTAVPAANWVFNYWSGNLVGSISPATLVITGNMSVLAYFAQIPYQLTVNIIGSGSVTLNATSPYYYGTVVQLTATAAVGYTFQGWSGNLSGSVNPTTIVIEGNELVNATFTANQYTITVNVSGGGSVTLSPNTAYYYYGVMVQLTAVASNGWQFDHWSGNLTGTVNPRYVYTTYNMSVTATFIQINYTLTVPVYGMGSVSLNETAPYHYGDIVLMIAVPTPGWSFQDWNGDLNSSVDPATLTVTKNMTVAAWFTQNSYTLTVNVAGSGSVTSNNTGPYLYGDVVLLTAVPAVYSSFDHWSGDLTGSANPATLVITANMSVTAYFIASPTILMSPANKTCRVLGESFAVTINVVNIINVENCTFGVHYNATLLGYLSVTWNAWESGTINVNESTGVIVASTSGNPLNGTQTLLTIEFEATYAHIWKKVAGWTNDLTDTIFFQWVNISSDGSDLQYQRGGVSQIKVSPDFQYTFSPIQGDVNNDGTVNVLDLRTIAAFYGVKTGDPNWTQASFYDLNGDGIIDENDLNLAAANYGYTYSP
jgi:uncharacterized protein (DUF2141 family)